jgi:hypothetical protein
VIGQSSLYSVVRGEDCLKVKKDYYNQYQVMTKDPLVQASKKKTPKN